MSDLPEALDDSQLVRLQRAGNERGFDTLYRAYFPRLVRVSQRWVRDQTAAEDVAQETILRALAYLSSFDDSKPMWPWLKGIARRVAADQMARDGRQAALSDHVTPHVDDPMRGIEERPLLQTALARLTPRHRTALHLRYLEDWESGQAASFFGMTDPAFRQLLARARGRLRSEYRRASKGLLGAAWAPLRWLRDAARRASERLEAGTRSVPSFTWTVPADTMHQVVTGVVALALVVGGMDVGAGGADSADLLPKAEAATHAVAPSPLLPPDSTGVGGLVGRPEVGGAAEESSSDPDQRSGGEEKAGGAGGQGGNGKPPVNVEEPVEATEEYLPETAEDVTDPNGDVEQPEDAQITSIAGSEASPGEGSGYRSYNAEPEAPQLLLAAGTSTCQHTACPYVLFRSEDGGATWSKLPAEGFRGEQLLLPPDFEWGDDRIFAMGSAGLQVSEDGGETFRSAVKGAASPVGPAAISPAFSSGDPSILIGGTVLYRYNADAESVETVPVPGAQGPFHPAYSPAYPKDGLIYLGGSRFEVGYGMTASISKCGGKGCSHTSLRGQVDLPQLAFGQPMESGYRQLYAFTLRALFSSSNGGGNFDPVPTGWSAGRLADVELHDGILWAAVVSDGEAQAEGLYLSHDHGSTWSRAISSALNDSPVSLYSSGDRLLVTLEKSGMACSIDRGETWHERCPGPPGNLTGSA